MKIVLSSQGKANDALVDVRFGRCKYFAVYDVESNTFEFFENSGKESNQGAGIAAAQMVLEFGVDALLTERLGPKAFKVLQVSDIELLRCHGMSLKDAVERYKTKSLETITEPYRV